MEGTVTWRDASSPDFEKQLPCLAVFPRQSLGVKKSVDKNDDLIQSFSMYGVCFLVGCLFSGLFFFFFDGGIYLIE